MAAVLEADSKSSTIAFMELALEQVYYFHAKFAMDNLEVPIGCVIVEDGKAVAAGSNRTTATQNATRHAEMEAIDILLEKWQNTELNQFGTFGGKGFKCTAGIMSKEAIALLRYFYEQGNPNDNQLPFFKNSIRCSEDLRKPYKESCDVYEILLPISGVPVLYIIS